MATRTIIDGGKQAITFNNDTEPVAVYVDGELQQNVSFVPQLAQGTGSAQYKSEYKKNHIGIEMQGTTEQGTYTGNISQTSSLTPYASFVEDFTINSYGRILRSTQPIVLPTTSESVIAKLVDYESIESQIPDYETLFLINENKDTLYVLYANNTEAIQTIPTNDTYYLAIADETDAGNDNIRCYGLFVQNAKLQVEYYVTSTTPTPETPIPIENANSEGMSITLRGINPFKFKDFSGELVDSKGNILSYEMKDGIMTLNGKYDGFTTFGIPFSRLAVPSPTFKAGTYTFTPYYYRVQGQRRSGCDWNLGGYAYSGATGLATKTFDKNFGYGNCSLYILGEYEEYKYAPAIFEGTYTSLDELPPYEPYFEPTKVEIPSSVEVDNGDGTTKTVDLPFTIYDKLVVDRVANTVTYEKKSGVKVFTGNENFDIGTSNVRNAYEYEFPLARAGFNITTANGYCTHFTPVTAENISKIGDVCFILSPTNRPYMSFVYDDFGYSLSEFELAEEEFKSWVAEQYSAGTPLTIVVEYEEVEPIDITQSSLAQSLLNLATQNQTNYFEITSNEKAPQVPIKINYAKWGELVENNNNT